MGPVAGMERRVRVVRRGGMIGLVVVVRLEVGVEGRRTR